MRPLIIALLLALPLSGYAQVDGEIRDSVTLQPIPDARVIIRATNTSTNTAADGSFLLTGASGPDLVIGVGKQGYFVGGATVSAPASSVLIELDPVPVVNDASYESPEPSSCIRCHFNQTSQWRQSAMAKAGVNLWVYDIYDGTGTNGGMGGFVYTRDSPHAAHNPASECRSCHQPEGWLAEPHSALGDLSNPTPAMEHGVSCDVCHKVAWVDETKPNYPGLYPGTVTMTRPSTAAPFAVQYGVLGDVVFNDRRMRAAYNPQMRALLCATCHQDKNDPDADGDFEEANGVISEPTYLEWLASPYADPDSGRYADCVDCHMKPSGFPVACDMLFPPVVRPLEQVRSHTFEGTNAEFLDNALTATITATVSGRTLAVTVSITNDRTGHHVPTGVTIRNMLLLVEATRPRAGAQDELTLTHTGTQALHALAGTGDPAAGYFGGLPGKLYAKLNHGPDGTGPVFFTDATGIQFDTRIPALATDTTSYTFDVPPTGGALTVRARVIYRRSWRVLVDAKSWTEDGYGRPLEDIAPPHFGHLMTEVSAAVDTEPAPPGCDAGACIDAGPADSGLADADAADAAVASDAGLTFDAGTKPDDDDGCDCATSGGGERAGWLAILALVGLRRRRRSR